MKLFHRKSRWQKAMGAVGSAVPKKSATKAGAAAATGVAIAAASAAVSSYRRKSET